MVKPEAVSTTISMALLARDIAKKIEAEPGISRTDQGQPHPGKPRGGLRQVIPARETKPLSLLNRLLRRSGSAGTSFTFSLP